MKIADYMSAPVYCVRPYDQLAHAREEMINRDVGALPVLDDASALVGIVTAADLAFKQAVRRHPDRRAPGGVRSVGDVMTEMVTCVEGEGSLAQAAQAMLAQRASALPVIEAGGSVAGILTRTDVLRAAAEALRAAPPLDHLAVDGFKTVHRHASAVRVLEAFEKDASRVVGVVESGAGHRGPERAGEAHSTTGTELPWELVGVVSVDEMAFGEWLESAPTQGRGRAASGKRIEHVRKRSPAGRKSARHVETVQWTAEDLMRTTFPVFDITDGAGKAAKALGESRLPAAPVVDESGTVRGCVTAHALLERFVHLTREAGSQARGWQAPPPR